MPSSDRECSFFFSEASSVKEEPFDSEKVAAYISALKSDEYSEREKASKSLATIIDTAVSRELLKNLRGALTNAKIEDLEAKKRIKRLLIVHP